MKLTTKLKPIALGVLVASCLTVGMQQESKGAILIDDFTTVNGGLTTGTQTLNVVTTDWTDPPNVGGIAPGTDTGTNLATGIPTTNTIGGTRRLTNSVQVENNESGGSIVQLMVLTSSDLVSWSNPTGVQSISTVTWDNSGTGLGGLDLTPGNDGFIFNITNDLAGFTIGLRACTTTALTDCSQGNVSTAVQNLTETQLFIDFNDFAVSSGSGVQFNNVGYLQMILTGPEDLDATIRLAQAGPNPNAEVPEPTSVLSILGIGVLGRFASRKKKENKV